MRSSRYLLTAGAVVAVLAIALIIGLQLNQRQQAAANPSASPSSTPSASPATVVNPSASQSATTTPPAATGTPAPGGAIYDDSFGFIVVENGKASFRRESSNTRLSSFDQQGFAVSPDGASTAYWTLSTGSSPSQLRIIGGVSELTLVTLAVGQRGGGIAWSSDGAAVVYSTDSGGSIGGATNASTLNIYELAANGRHGTTIATETNTGWFYRPIAWDRSANLVAAGLTGEGGGMGFYVTVRLNPDNSFTTQRVDTKSPGRLGVLMQSVHASSDAKLVLGVDFESGDIRWWPVADYAAGKTEPAAGKRGALWRPGTHEIGFMSGEQLWLGDVDKAGAHGLCCTAFSGVPATSSLRTFRADGSAVLIAAGLTGSTELGDFILVRLGSDPKATSGDRVTFKELGGLATSVRFR